MDITTSATPAGHVPKLAYTIEQSCQASNLSRATLYKAINARELSTITVGRKRLVLADELLRWLSSKRAA